MDRKGKREATTNTKIQGFLRNFPISSSLALLLFYGCMELTPSVAILLPQQCKQRKCLVYGQKVRKEPSSKKDGITDFDHVLTGKEQKINDSAEKEVM